VRPRKSLGQHFLSDVGLLRRIVDALAPEPGETVLEIGPGEGGLTRELLARGARVVAIEKDDWLAEKAREWGGGSGTLLDVVNADALDVDWAELAALRTGTTPHSPQFSVTGNIPYNITTPLIEKALTPPLPRRIVFLVQLEVAQRVAAPPGSKTYGGLSVGVQAACVVERLFTVKAGAFRPPPRVDSAVLRLTPRDQPLVRPEETAAFRRFVSACFSQRRKQLRNAVAAAADWTPAQAAGALESLGIDPTARPETLSPEAFVRLLRCSPSL
jgi:16S rRNA (adenine1518-N6/adenine1519-N6)-dimethyltransferase